MPQGELSQEAGALTRNVGIATAGFTEVLTSAVGFHGGEQYVAGLGCAQCILAAPRVSVTTAASSTGCSCVMEDGQLAPCGLLTHLLTVPLE